jgi:hypothetical protein
MLIEKQADTQEENAKMYFREIGLGGYGLEN